MATTHLSMHSQMPFSNQCIDVDNFDDSVFDFNAISSTPTPSSSKLTVSRSSPMTSPTNTSINLDQNDDLQTPAMPSHEYDRYKQQTGLPPGSVNALTGLSQSSQQSDFDQSFAGFSTGFDEMSFLDDSELSGTTRFGMTADPSMEWDTTPSSLPTSSMFRNMSQSESEDFVDPSAITSQEEPAQAPVRFFPGMHQQQAALARAQQQQRQQQQLLHQRQQQQQQQQQAAQQAAQRQRDQQARSHPSRKSASHITDARTEETIARVVNQIRQSSNSSKDDGSGGSSNLLPQIVRMKKDEEDMDEDERLLASEEGKKLSSKERRQLRNKVSARAFRSRRKEYIGQLEGEVAVKTNECNDLRAQNRALMEENARSRAFIEKLLRHPAFNPFLEDLSRDPALTESLGQQHMPSASPQPQQSQARKESSPAQFQQSPPVSMSMMAEQQPHTSGSLNVLNLNADSETWAMPNMGFNFQAPQVFAVLELPEGPSSLDTEAITGKGTESLFSEPVEEDCKLDFPQVDRPISSASIKEYPAVPEETVEAVQSEQPEDDSEIEEDPAFALYGNRSSTRQPTSSSALSDFEPLFGVIEPEKVFARFELYVPNDADNAKSELLEHRLDSLCAVADRHFYRIQALTAFLDL